MVGKKNAVAKLWRHESSHRLNFCRWCRTFCWPFCWHRAWVFNGIFFPTPSFWKLWEWATWISLLMWDFFSTTSPSQQDSSYSTLHLPLKIDITTPEKSDGKKLEDEKTIGSASLLKWFSIKKLAVEDVESPELMGWLVGWKVVVFFSSSL